MPQNTQQETERRAVRSEDLSFSPLANELLTREVQQAVGAKKVEVPWSVRYEAGIRAARLVAPRNEIPSAPQLLHQLALGVLGATVLHHRGVLAGLRQPVDIASAHRDQDRALAELRDLGGVDEPVACGAERDIDDDPVEDRCLLVGEHMLQLADALTI